MDTQPIGLERIALTLKLMTSINHGKASDSKIELSSFECSITFVT